MSDKNYKMVEFPFMVKWQTKMAKLIHFDIIYLYYRN